MSKQSGSREQSKAYFTYTSVPSHDASGKIDRVVIYALDETENHLHEENEECERMRVIFNNLSTVVWSNTFTPIADVDEAGKVRFMLVSAVDMTEQVETP